MRYKWAVICFIVLALSISCGKSKNDALVPSDVDTSLFDGVYEIVNDPAIEELKAELKTLEPGDKKNNLEGLIRFLEERNKNFSIKDGVIHSGEIVIQEFSIFNATIEDNTLKGMAYWHEDKYDPGDYAEVKVLLKIDDDILGFIYWLPEGGDIDDIGEENMSTFQRKAEENEK